MPAPPSPLVITKGTCFALFAYDIGLSINLTEAERRITASTERGRLRHKARAPQYFEYRPAPLRLVQEGGVFAVGLYQSSPTVEVMVYDFGAVTITYRFPLDGPFDHLLDLSESLYENEQLLMESRTRVDQLIHVLSPAIERPRVADEVEDYLIFSIESCQSAGGRPLWMTEEAELARILRAERTPLSEQETADALSCRISFGLEDAALIDWNAAVLFGKEMDDVRAVLEFANVELLEMRLLDEQLDRSLDQAYEALSRKPRLLSLPGSHEKDTTHIAQLQVDAALLFERVTNTLKLLGDQYLARVYRLVSQRFHLEAWDASILRKLQTLESIYGKMSDRAGTRRMEVLEWIIIVLIAVSIAVSFLPPGH
ncbi:hypothetical protein [Nitrospira moscoviensis]|uniref:DUF155 domain-containing protein n=1 Tax=Nitrospira moscoviensis TaxID=42253 RepID=A0A0K2GKD1_NITMO|nr:hypothetical protein [Nitrospira moscoviensis]ALA61087.1 hypothetical protein NITMOv2_4718 [Nitrospira moscoviensis]